MIKYLDNNFDNEIKNGIVLVDFYADWCGPCRMMSSILEEINNIDILKVNVDKFPLIAQKYGVISIPSLFLFKNGILIKKHTGFLDKKSLLDFVK